MNREEKEIPESNFFEKVFKTLVYTFLVFIVSLFGVYSIAEWIFPNVSVGESNTLAIISLFIGVIFTIFYCTLTILEELKKRDL